MAKGGAASLRTLRARAKAEEQAQLFLAAIGSRLPSPVREYRFDETRRWKFDYAWCAQRVALESEGGVFVAGGHNRGAKFVKDCEKYNAATLAGWRVFRIPAHLLTTEGVRVISLALG